MTDTTLGPQVSWAANNILRDETWYGTGAPLWFEGPNGVRCQSETQAALGRVRLIKRLKRFGASDIAAQGLVCRLATCAPGQRCCSGACAECGRAFQRWFVNSVARFLAAEKANEPSESSILSIIHDSGRVEPGQLVTSDAHERLWHRVTAALAHVDVKAASAASISRSTKTPMRNSYRIGCCTPAYTCRRH